MTHSAPVDHAKSGSGRGDDLAAQRKRLFSVIFAIAIGALLIGGIGIFNGIGSPFPKVQKTTNASNAPSIASILSQQDTDDDGLNDYEEIYTYQTSVFVRDSDSDGASDKEEVTQQTDPNCPKDKDCSLIPTNTNSVSGSQAVSLRTTLQKAGVPQSVLDSTDDATLLKSYQDVIGTGSTTNSSTELGSLGPAQVRSLLKSTGLDQATLDAVDDVTLMQIFQDAIGTSN